MVIEYSRPWLFGVCQWWFAFGYNRGRFGCCVAVEMVLRVDCGAPVRLCDMEGYG